MNRQSQWLQSVTSELISKPDPRARDYPQTPQTIASAKAQQAADREEVFAPTGIRITDEEEA